MLSFMTKKLLTLILTLYILGNIQAQVFLSNHALISIENKALLSVRGDLINHANGFIYNTDTIDLIGDWQNDNAANAMDSTYSGIVRLTGSNQTIKGIYPTYFYSLSLENTGIKYALLDQYAYGKLLLNDRELNMNTATFYVKNPLLNAVSNTDGFVSSTNDGGLERNMNSIGTYIFPLGSSSSGILYRPISITTKDNLFQVYKAGMTNNDATSDGFDRDLKERFICTINPAFYHRIYKQTTTNPVNLDFMYMSTDGTFNDIAHWDNTTNWLNTDTTTAMTSAPFQVIRLLNWTDFTDQPFALAYSTAPFGLAGNDTSIYLGTSLQLLTDANSNAVWSPDYNISCINCENPIVNPDSTTTYYVTTDRSDGCKNIDTIRVTVIPSLDNLEIFIPNVITPNSDGSNDYWNIRALEQFPNNEVIILNRWGDQIFVKKPYDNSFNGTLWGKELPEGTYYYLVKIQVNEDKKTFDGPLTIIR